MAILGRKDPKSRVLFGRDVSKISQLGYKSINAGNQITAATEAVVGKGTGEGKPVVAIGTSERVQESAEVVAPNLMKTEISLSHTRSLNRENKPPSIIISLSSNDSAGFVISRDSLSNGKYTYRHNGTNLPVQCAQPFWWQQGGYR